LERSARWRCCYRWLELKLAALWKRLARLRGVPFAPRRRPAAFEPPRCSRAWAGVRDVVGEPDRVDALVGPRRRPEP
jgi:hypothetical protein